MHIVSGTYIWYIHHSLHLIQFLISDIFYSLLSYYSTVSFNHSYMIFITVEWFRHILILLTFLFSPPWRWPHEWPKHVGEPLCNKITYIKPSEFLGLFIYFMRLSNDQNMGHIKLYKMLLYGLFCLWIWSAIHKPGKPEALGHTGQQCHYKQINICGLADMIM
jgi:hypothetical protein